MHVDIAYGQEFSTPHFLSESFGALSHSWVESLLVKRMEKYLDSGCPQGTKSLFFILGIKRLIVFLVSNCWRDSLGAHHGYVIFWGSCGPSSHLTPRPASVATAAPTLLLCIPNPLFALSLPLFLRSFLCCHGFQFVAICKVR